MWSNIHYQGQQQLTSCSSIGCTSSPLDEVSWWRSWHMIISRCGWQNHKTHLCMSYCIQRACPQLCCYPNLNWVNQGQHRRKKLYLCQMCNCYILVKALPLQLMISHFLQVVQNHCFREVLGPSSSRIFVHLPTSVSLSAVFFSL